MDEKKKESDSADGTQSIPDPQLRSSPQPATDGKIDEKRASAEEKKKAESSAKSASSVNNDNGPERSTEKDANAEGGGAAVVDEGGRVVSEEEVEDGANHVKGIPLMLLAFGLCVTTFLVGLDQLIIATVSFILLDSTAWETLVGFNRRVITGLGMTTDAARYGSAYLLSTTSLQPSFGKIYSFWSIRNTFVCALAIFEVGSIVCASANGSKALIVGRAVAGIGAAGLFSGGMTIIAFSVPLRRRPIYLAALSSMFGVSSIVGPILGGVFTDRLTWRWCFWINLPFGGIAIVSVLLFFKEPKRTFADIGWRQKLKEMDIIGATFLVGAIVCLLLALSWGGLQFPWSDSKVWGCFIGFGLLISIFIAIQLRLGDRATIPPRVLKQRTIAACALTLTFMSMGLFAHIYYLPFYFQAVKGTTAEGSGIRVIPYLMSNTIFAIIVGGCVTAVGYYTPFIWLGTARSGLIYTLAVDSSRARWIGYQVIAGGGSGAAIQLPFIAVQVVLSAKEMPTGNAVAIFFNSLGGAISISISSNIFSNSLERELPKEAPGVDPKAVIQAGATALRSFVPKELLPGVLTAYNKALDTAFILPIAVAVLSFLSSLAFEWRSVKGKKLMAGGPG